MKGGVRGLAEQFLRGEPQHPARGRVDECHATGGIRAEDAFGAGLEDQPGALLCGSHLAEQILRPQVSLEHLEAQRHQGQRFVQQGQFPPGHRSERRPFDHAQQAALGQQRFGHGLRGRGASQPGSNAQILQRELVEHDPGALACALADQALAGVERLSAFCRLVQTVSRDPLQPAGCFLNDIKTRHSAAQQRHQPGQQSLTKFRQGRRGLQVANEFGAGGFDPSLLIHRGGPLFQDLNRTGQTACFIRGLGVEPPWRNRRRRRPAPRTPARGWDWRCGGRSTFRATRPERSQR